MNYFLFDKVANDLSLKIVNNHISNITCFSNSDILFTFSFYRKEKLFVSLEHQEPNLSLISTNTTPRNIENKLSENLRRFIKDSYIISISTLNEDRILEIKVAKSLGPCLKEGFYLIIEFFPKRPNLIILNEERDVLYATHLESIVDGRVILKEKYHLPLSKGTKDLKEFDFDEYKSAMLDKFEYRLKVGIKEKHLELFKYVLNREKQLNKKITSLENEVAQANKDLIYKEHGDAMLYLEGEDLLNYVKENHLKYDDHYDNVYHANLYFKRYKKSKVKIKEASEQLEKAKEDLKDIYRYLIQLDNDNEDDIIGIEEEVLGQRKKSKHPSNKKALKDTRLPYYVIYNNVKIGFGRNDIQNDKLTFELAKREHYFLHIDMYPGPHVVIFHDHPSKEVIDVACDIAAYYANREQIDVMFTQIKNVKKTHKLGLVNVKVFERYHVDKVLDSTIELLKTRKKWNA